MTIRYCCNSPTNETHEWDCPRRAVVGDNIDEPPEEEIVKKETVKIKITGPAGSGKTTVAAILAGVLIEAGFEVDNDEPLYLDKFKARKASIIEHSKVEIKST